MGGGHTLHIAFQCLLTCDYPRTLPCLNPVVATTTQDILGKVLLHDLTLMLPIWTVPACPDYQMGLCPPCPCSACFGIVRVCLTCTGPMHEGSRWGSVFHDLAMYALTDGVPLLLQHTLAHLPSCYVGNALCVFSCFGFQSAFIGPRQYFQLCTSSHTQLD